MEQKKEQNIPVLPWMRHPVDISLSERCPTNYLPLLDQRLEKALQKMGITSLFPVQVAVWHETIGPGSFERDLCVNSPTGSGKTLAYALPIVQSLSTHTIKCLRALVVLPTRDLAMQVKEVFAALAPAVGLSVGLAVGQSSLTDEISDLITKPELDADIYYDSDDPPRSKVDILVATPGRLMDHINNTKGFTLGHLCYLVIDETDRLLREAYQSWLPSVLKLAYSGTDGPFPSATGQFLPKYSSLRTIRSFGVERGFRSMPHPRLAKMVLSATLTRDPSKLAQLDLHYPLFLTMGKKRYQIPGELESFKLVCKSKLKPLYLLALLETLQGEKTIVFTSSVESTHRLRTLLKSMDEIQISVEEYSRLQRQFVRSKTLNAFREGDIQVLISSDAMARGMDVDGIRNVINYDMPEFIKTYIHRAGRTARAGGSGRCITLLRKDQLKRFNTLLEKADCEPCPDFPVAAELIDSYLSVYDKALERLKVSVESERHNKGQSPRKKKI